MTLIEINKKNNQIVQHRNIFGLIGHLEMNSRIEFKKRFGFEKTNSMCLVEFCPNEAEFVWNVPFWLRVLRFFNGESNYPTAKYCKKCLRNSCYRLRTPRKYWREI